MSPHKFRVIFFDVHETLIHLNATPPEIFTKLCSEAGHPIDLAEVEDIYPEERELEERREAHGDDDSFWTAFNSSLITELGLSDSDGKLVQNLVKGFLEDRWWSAYEDAKPALLQLKEAGYLLGVIANARDVIVGRLEHTGLTAHFDSITYSAEVGVPKPDSKIFHTAMERIGCTPDEAVHIGDRWREDVEGARAVGIKPIYLDRENENRDVDVWHVQSLSEIAGLIS